MTRLERTSDYSLFKLLRGNRDLNKPHMNKMKEAIESDNRLNLHPIIVNKNFEVIDGQHRLQCAKELGVDIFYIRSEDVENKHIINCNVNQKPF